MVPASEQVRGQLERILGSSTFSGAGRHSRLLRYLVERTLGGGGDQLKEYVLGTEVFDRPESYDPRLDSIVRVEVRRLRARLEEYYNHEGQTDEVVFSIPRGNYTPTFALREPLPAPPEQKPATARTSGLRAFVLFTSAAALVLILLALAGQMLSREPAAQASGGPSIIVLPFEHYSTNQTEALAAAHLTDAVTTELARLRTLSVVSRTSASQYSERTHSIAEIRQTLGVDYVMESTAAAQGASTVASVRVIDATTDRKVWVGEYTLTSSDLPAAARRMAYEAAEGTLKYHARRAAITP